jgi:hypothetical protein
MVFRVLDPSPLSKLVFQVFQAVFTLVSVEHRENSNVFQVFQPMFMLVCSLFTTCGTLQARANKARLSYLCQPYRT